jgi:hypothetical protein
MHARAFVGPAASPFDAALTPPGVAPGVAVLTLVLNAGAFGVGYTIAILCRCA